MENKKLSIIIPSYNEEGSISKISNKLKTIMESEKIPYELIFVNDGSSDKTWEMIKKENELNSNVCGISFSRNFGKEEAMRAGLSYASGACAVIIDADLQHPPEKIPEMYRKWEEGFEVVECVKRTRGKEPFLHSFAANTFYKIMSSIIHIDVKSASDFKLIDRKVINVLLSIDEKSFFFRALSSNVGFLKTKIEFDVQEREIGESKWSIKSLIKYAINNITAFSNLPLQFPMICAVFTFALSIVLITVAIVNADWSTISLIIHCITTTMILSSLGIIGYYIGKIYEEAKDRPNYIIKDVITKKRDDENEGI